MNFLFGDYLWVVVLHIVLVFILYFTTVKKPKTSSTLSPMEPIIICYKRYFDFKGIGSDDVKSIILSKKKIARKLISATILELNTFD